MAVDAGRDRLANMVSPTWAERLGRAVIFVLR